MMAKIKNERNNTEIETAQQALLLKEALEGVDQAMKGLNFEMPKWTQVYCLIF